ncbi:MAG: hypothetical protein SOT07_00735 [Paludibacteraceae bacterium]|nr:hypothetical protein [Paludibacteraceae bacterium]
MATKIEIQNDARMERLMSSDPKMARQLQKIIRKAIRAAARRVSQDARSVLGNDPRRAAAAVRSSVYRAILGGQVNILSPRRAAKKGSLYEPARTGREGQRGGNRVKRSARTEQMMSYTGADRGFILRWVESGTGVRTSRYGNRGSISARPWFTRSATSALETAAQEIVPMVEALLMKEGV